MTSLFEYSDYRVFLKDYFAEKKRTQRGWSLAVWARKLSLKSPSTLLMILQGTRNPGPELTAGLVRYFGFTPKEADFFGTLVQLAKHQGDTGMSVLLMERLSRDAAGGKFTFLDHDTFSAISRWYYYAIRELVQLPGFRENPYWIARNLKFTVSTKEVKEAIQRLLKLGLLTRGPRGKLIPAHGNLNTASDFASEGLKRFHEETLENAKQSLRKIAPSEREIQGSTFAIRRKDLPKAKELIRKFQDEFCSLLERTDGDALYHIELAFYPLFTMEKGEQENDPTLH
jgi:uncharacterized protein (TIGR02147 family)